MKLLKLRQDEIDNLSEILESFEVSKFRTKEKVITQTKPDGSKKTRVLILPNTYAKNIQHKLLLSLNRIDLPRYVFSKKGASSVDKAKFHAEDSCLINIDIQDFFPTVNYYMVKNMLKSIGIPDRLCNKILRITTYKNTLPLGYCTSPLLANLVLYDFDEKAFHLAKLHGWKYSRYFDDISISGEELNPRDSSMFMLILKGFGFKVNSKKTTYFGPGETKTIMGLQIVDKQLKLMDTYLQKVQEHINETIQFISSGVTLDRNDFYINRLRGELAYCKQVSPELYKQFINGISSEMLPKLFIN